MNVNKTTLEVANPLYDISFIKDLQGKVDKNYAKAINSFLASEKNDLGLSFNQKKAEDLNVYWNILERLIHCDSCFKEQEVEDIIELTKNSINAI